MKSTLACLGILITCNCVVQSQSMSPDEIRTVALGDSQTAAGRKALASNG